MIISSGKKIAFWIHNLFFWILLKQWKQPISVVKSLGKMVIWIHHLFLLIIAFYYYFSISIFGFWIMKDFNFLIVKDKIFFSCFLIFPLSFSIKMVVWRWYLSIYTKEGRLVECVRKGLSAASFFVLFCFQGLLYFQKQSRASLIYINLHHMYNE